MSDLKAIKEAKITAPDMPISMNMATERLTEKMIEWEEHPEHFDGVNPFSIAIYEIRQKTLKWEAQRPKSNCSGANHDAGGCLGYCYDENDDEPIDACKTCSYYSGNREGGEVE